MSLTHGHRFNPAKLLLDPYAKAVTGLVNWSAEMFGYVQDGSADADLTPRRSRQRLVHAEVRGGR